ncbi:MAG: primosomal protein N' [Candidatus Cloacimonetes bacterium]|nr:primosomal protein N' [Candidatus Cloacimonadota bacterium]
MPFYDIALPSAVRQVFTYRSQQPIQRGCRVVVPLGSRLVTGVVWNECAESDIDKKLKLRDIIEQVDEAPLVGEDLLSLAQWMASYYRAPLGMCFFAMLPGGLDVVHQRDARLCKAQLPLGCDQHDTTLYQALSSLHWTPLADLKSLGIPGLHRRLEAFESAGIISLRRSHDTRVRQRVANHVILQADSDIAQLTDRQSEVVRQLREQGGEAPLARLAESFSYSVIKALRNKGIVLVEAREQIDEDKLDVPEFAPQEITLTDEQQSALNAISKAIAAQRGEPFLLHGVTGSGKTELYIRAIEQVLALERTALILVPEISLTPQLMGRFFAAFGDRVAVLHSHLSLRQRLQQWRKLADGRCTIALGARSAIFAPLRRLGVIIVDEEHENSYKQDSTPRYNARDIALVRARKHSCPVILGSATPSLESWHNAAGKRYSLLQLHHRPFDVALPEVAIHDLRGQEDVLSETLLERIEHTLKRGEQALLFLNRRGHASHVQCIGCGNLYRCPHCDISLSYHSHGDSLVCHYCGHRQSLPRRCPKCGNPRYSFGVPGTQQVEQRLKVIFPQASILRMDSDTTSGRDSYTSMFERMRSGAIDILLGTQMIAKGLDFENVSLVGVVSADVSLNLPDFRAAERTFQLLTQVAGRAGRRHKTGQVIVQTWNPDHYAITCARAQNFEEFATIESELRKQFFYPPYSRLGRVVFAHPNDALLQRLMADTQQSVTSLRGSFASNELQALGPVPAPFTKLFDRYRQHILLKAASPSALSRAMKQLLAGLKLPSTVKLTVDIDPSSLL